MKSLTFILFILIKATTKHFFFLLSGKTNPVEADTHPPAYKITFVSLVLVFLLPVFSFSLLNQEIVLTCSYSNLFACVIFCLLRAARDFFIFSFEFIYCVELNKSESSPLNRCRRFTQGYCRWVLKREHSHFLIKIKTLSNGKFCINKKYSPALTVIFTVGNK